MEDEHGTIWDIISPGWMFQARPEDFAHRRPSVCLGVYYMHGLYSLFLLHLGCFWLVINAVFTGSYRPYHLLYLLPVLVTWLVCIPADIKFRLQRPTRLERWAFDNTFVNWVGYLTLPFWCLVTLAIIVTPIVVLVRHFFA